MAYSTFVFVSSNSCADVVLFICDVIMLNYHPYVIDWVISTFRLSVTANNEDLCYIYIYAFSQMRTFLK